MTQPATQGSAASWRTADCQQARANSNPDDPWWRSREPGRELDPTIADALCRARVAQGWSFRAASDALGLSAGYLCELERGRRIPSLSVAVILVVGYQLTDPIARQLYRVARPWVGRDSPFRTGYYPERGEHGLPWGGTQRYARWCR